MTDVPALVLAAHGSADPGFAAVVEAIAEQVRAGRPGIAVVAGYLDHGVPTVAQAASAGSVVVPLLLTSGYHVVSDIPAQAPGCVVAPAVGPDPRIASVLAERVHAAGWHDQLSVVLAAAGSSDPAALEDARTAGHQLAAVLGVPVATAFLSAGEPRLAELDLAQAAIASYLLGPGHFATVVECCGAPVVAAPLGPHPALAEIILDRYDAARF